ncbi:hypothetical protein AAT16_04365 [Salinicoccus halodurans]|uniref:Uncharacterized protein n=1 Tax=Salinicoccus halodurans TaxID=407035 RepID=A0ABN4G7Z8_9STAP|nr:hypothetical protein AAT16_04365 [Salinicoccus halodurans]
MFVNEYTPGEEKKRNGSQLVNSFFLCMCTYFAYGDIICINTYLREGKVDKEIGFIEKDLTKISKKKPEQFKVISNYLTYL